MENYTRLKVTGTIGGGAKEVDEGKPSWVQSQFRSIQEHSPGLNWIFTPASLWIFLIISPFRPITTPTEWRGTEICRILEK